MRRSVALVTSQLLFSPRSMLAGGIGEGRTVQRMILTIVLTSILVASGLPATPEVVAGKPKCDGRVATIVGTNKSETIRGTKKADVIVAKRGADTVDGRGGKDTVCGGGGEDTLNGGDGADLLKGGSGQDALNGGRGGDTLDGGPSQDACDGGPGNDWLFSCNEPATTGTLTIVVDTTLTAPHVGHIVIDADDVTLDCDGHTVSGPGAGLGISGFDFRGVTIKNCRVTDFADGIHLGGAHDNTLSGNRVHGNSGTGIVLHSSNRNRIISNASNGSGWGFQLENSHDNVVEHNRASRNRWENFTLKHGSLRNRLAHNIARGARIGFKSTDDDSVFKDNTARGSREGFVMEGTGNTLRRNTAKNNIDGFNDSSDGGSGTKRTDNTYINNRCIGNDHASHPRGLC